MRYALVTSRVTYVPGNSLTFFQKVLEERADPIDALVIVENMSWYITKKAFLLFLLGAWGLASSILGNMVASLFDERISLARKHGVRVLHVSSPNDPRLVEYLREGKIDLVLNFRSREIVQRDVLAVPRLGWLSIHHGILPKWRGLFCDLYDLFEGRRAGFSIHKMEADVDAGDIYVTRYVSETHEKSYTEYLKKLALPEAEEILKLVDVMEKTESLPEKIQTKSAEQYRFCKTPPPKLLREMMKQGILI